MGDIKFDVNMDALKEQIFLASKSIIASKIDIAKAETTTFFKELRAITDTIAEAKVALASALPAEKDIKMQTLLYTQNSLDTLVERYKTLFENIAIETVKEIFNAAVKVIGHIALAMVLAAVG